MADNGIHLAIIPDGNRRWAKAHILDPWKGHEQAIETIQTILDWARENDEIAVLTMWLFSTENWKRDPKEIEKLMSMLEDYLKRERETFQKNQTRLLHSGRKDRIPESLAKLIEEIEQETAQFTKFTLHLALDYGGKDEVIRAINKLDATGSITDESLREKLDHPELPDIDIIIRTSGEQRTSNFFLWQSAYAEWFFTDTLFPDLKTDDIEGIIKEFKTRSRRFGGG